MASAPRPGHGGTATPPPDGEPRILGGQRLGAVRPARPVPDRLAAAHDQELDPDGGHRCADDAQWPASERAVADRGEPGVDGRRPNHRSEQGNRGVSRGEHPAEDRRSEREHTRAEQRLERAAGRGSHSAARPGSLTQPSGAGGAMPRSEPKPSAIEPASSHAQAPAPRTARAIGVGPAAPSAAEAPDPGCAQQRCDGERAPRPGRRRGGPAGRARRARARASGTEWAGEQHERRGEACERGESRGADRDRRRPGSSAPSGRGTGRSGSSAPSSASSTSRSSVAVGLNSGSGAKDASIAAAIGSGRSGRYAHRAAFPGRSAAQSAPGSPPPPGSPGPALERRQGERVDV